MIDIFTSPGIWLIIAGLLLVPCRAETRWVLVLGAPLIVLAFLACGIVALGQLGVGSFESLGF